MFEQSLYEPQQPAQPERVVTPPSEGDFLYSYEIKTWEVGPRIYKILGISAAANLLALLVVAQTSLLTMKGCDSPLVGGVCQVLDTVYVGAMLWGTDREMIDAEYDKTELGEDYDVTFVDMTGASPPISYPEGYFQIANRDELAAMAALATDPSMVTSGIPGIPDGLSMTPPSVSGGSMLDTKPNLPPVNSNPVQGDLPSAFGNNDQSAGGNLLRPGLRPKNKRPAKTPPATNPDGSIPGIPNSEQVAEVKPSPTPTPVIEPTAPVTGVELNSRPFADLATFINTMQDQKQVDLLTPFLVSASSKLKNGRFDTKSFRYVRKESPNPKMIEVVMETIEAMDASGYLQFLTTVGIDNVLLTIQQDDKEVKAFIESRFENDLRPKTIASLLAAQINTNRDSKSGADASANDKDDLLLLQNATVTPEGKKVTIVFTIPKESFQPMIQRKLAEHRNSPKEPNSMSSSRPQNNTASPK